MSRFNREDILRLRLAPIAAALVASISAVAIADDTRVARRSQQSDDRALIEDGFARWAKGEFDIFSLLADDVTWHITGQDPAIATTYHSREALLDGAARPLAARAAAPLKPTVRRIWSDGDDVIVHWEGTAPLVDGTTYRNTYLWIMTVRDGRVTAVTAFLDNAAFKRALATPLPSGSPKVGSARN